jgi:hypothetical protein
VQTLLSQTALSGVVETGAHLAVFHDNHQLAVVDEGLMVSNDVGVLNQRHVVSLGNCQLGLSNLGNLREDRTNQSRPMNQVK